MIPNEVSDEYYDLEYENWSLARKDAASAHSANLDASIDLWEIEYVAKAATCRTVGHRPDLSCCGGEHARIWYECLTCSETIITDMVAFDAWF